MKKLAFLFLVLLLFACGESQEPVTDSVTDTAVRGEQDIHHLFEQVTDSILTVDAISYSFEVEGVQIRETSLEFHSTGNALLQRGTGMDDAGVFLEYSTEDLQTGEIEQGFIASNSEYAAYLNITDGSYVYGFAEDGGAGIVHQHGVPLGTVIREFLFPEEPFGAELNAPGYRDLGEEEIAGVMCRVVAVDMSPFESTWWIDTETMLPLANKIAYWDADGSGMEYTVTIGDVNTDVQPDDGAFQLECPEGIDPQQVRGSIPAGSVAPNWSLETPEGTVVSLEDLRGKVVVMDFWATWCMPCRQVMPALQQLHEQYGEDLFVVGINVWEEAEDPAGFMADLGFTYPVLLGGDDVAVDYIVEGIPTFYVIAPDGTVAFHAVGADPANEEALMEVVGTLLQQ